VDGVADEDVAAAVARQTGAPHDTDHLALHCAEPAGAGRPGVEGDVEVPPVGGALEEDIGSRTGAPSGKISITGRSPVVVECRARRRRASVGCDCEGRRGRGREDQVFVATVTVLGAGTEPPRRGI